LLGAASDMIKKRQKQKIDAITAMILICAMILAFSIKNFLFMAALMALCMVTTAWSGVPVVWKAIRTGRFLGGGRIYNWENHKGMFCLGIAYHFLAFAMFALVLYALLLY
jgi:hypothetical protein